MKERERLEEIKKIRLRTEDEYYQLKKKNFETSDYIFYKSERINQMLQMKEVNSNPQLVEFYEENLTKLKEFSEKEAEYRDVLEKEWSRLNEEWDEEEASLKKSIEAKESEEKQKEDILEKD